MRVGIGAPHQYERYLIEVGALHTLADRRTPEQCFLPQRVRAAGNCLEVPDSSNRWFDTGNIAKEMLCYPT